MVGLGFGQQKSSNQQQAESQGPLGGGGGRTLVQRNLISSLLGPDWTQGDGGVLAALQGRTQLPNTYQTPTLTASGLLPEQQTSFEQAVRQAMTSASGNFANRGFLRPENIQAIAGSAAQNVAPQFAPLIERNVAQRTQAPLIQEDVTRQRFADLLNALGLGGTLLGGQSFSVGSGGSSGFQANFDNRTKV